MRIGKPGVRHTLLITVSLVILSFSPVFASDGSGENNHHLVGQRLLWIALILLAAKFGSLVERWRQPAVLGELVIGVALGNLALIGFTQVDPIKTDGIIAFLAELGVIILLFQTGLESNIDQMRKVGFRALAVASIGVAVPFALGYFLGPLLRPGLPNAAYVFIGATLTATSVGITARLFRDSGQLQTTEARIVLGAAVIDDVMGLIILAVVSALVTVGAVSFWTILLISGKALVFLAGSVFLGRFFAPFLGRWLSLIHAGTGVKLTLALCFGLLFAALASFIGLAPIVGAFAAGLVLDPVHFRHFEHPAVITDARRALADAPAGIRMKLDGVFERHSDRHVEDLIEPIAHFVVPIFFILTGMRVHLALLLSPHILFVALGLTVLAVLGKVISGIAAGRQAKPWIVGWGMVPRGEVGLIFATMGHQLGVLSEQEFSILIIVVILTTLITPLALAPLLRRQKTIPA